MLKFKPSRRYRKNITKLEGMFEDTTFIQKTLLHKYTYKKTMVALGFELTSTKLIVVKKSLHFVSIITQLRYRIIAIQKK